MVDKFSLGLCESFQAQWGEHITVLSRYIVHSGSYSFSHSQCCNNRSCESRTRDNIRTVASFYP